MKIELEKQNIDSIELLMKMNEDLVRDEAYDRTPPVDEWRKRWEGFLTETDKYSVYTFLGKDELIGYAVVHIDSTPMYIRHFFIIERFRKQGLGRASFDALLNELEIDTVDLDCMWWNETGLAFWRSLGFKERLIGMTLKK